MRAVTSCIRGSIAAYMYVDRTAFHKLVFIPFLKIFVRALTRVFV